MDVLRKFNKGEMKAPSNSVMHNVMITGYGKHGMPNQAFKIYNQVMEKLFVFLMPD